MAEETAMTTVEPAGALTPPADPDDAAKMLARDITLAKMLKDVVDKTGSSVMISGREHLKFEAWLTLGKWARVLPSCLKTTDLVMDDGSTGWEADSIAVDIPTGKQLSRAQAMCMSSEPNWNTRPKYDKDTRAYVGEEPVSDHQRRSMAQTRANAKVLANVLRSIVVLANYDPTPADEMHEEGLAGSGAAPEKPAMPKPRPSRNGAAPKNGDGEVVISPKQVKLVWGRLFGAGKNADGLRGILEKRGYAAVEQVTKGDLDKILEDIGGGDQAA